MTSHYSTVWLVLALVPFLVHSPTQAADATSLSLIPPGANAIAIIDVDQILKSPMGVQGHWKENLKNAYTDKPLIVPPNASHLVMASKINPSTMQPEWEVSIINLKTTPSMKRIATAEGGFVDSVAGKQAVWSPINAYYVRLDSRLLGVVAPANRQFAGWWARHIASQGNQLSTYLQSAADSMNAKTSYLFAMDLRDAVSPVRARRRIESDDFASLNDKKRDAEQIAELFGGIRGVTLRVSIGEEAEGFGVVDFSGPATALEGLAKPLLLEILGDVGAAIDGLDKWRFAVKGSAVTFEGNLPVEGLRQLVSIVDPPSPLAADDSKDSPEHADDSDNAGKNDAKVVAASKQYYTAIARITENVGKKVRGSTSLTQGAKWVAADARRIARLPISNVDPDLVAWGNGVSANLNELATAVGLGGLQARSRTVGIQDAYVSGSSTSDLEITGDPNDRIAKQNVKRQRLAASAEQRAATAQIATRILMEIEASRAKIRTAMVQKYNTEF